MNREVSLLGSKLRYVYHGKKILRPTWKQMDDVERDGWYRLARYFLRKLKIK